MFNNPTEKERAERQARITQGLRDRQIKQSERQITVTNQKLDVLKAEVVDLKKSFIDPTSEGRKRQLLSRIALVEKRASLGKSAEGDSELHSVALLELKTYLK